MTKKRMSAFVHGAARFAFRAVATMMVATTVVMAQTGGGATLVGTVKDASGSFVAQASVTVVNTATAFVTTTTTTAEGAYYVPYLIPGDYRVSVKAAGFSGASRSVAKISSVMPTWINCQPI